MRRAGFLGLWLAMGATGNVCGQQSAATGSAASVLRHARELHAQHQLEQAETLLTGYVAGHPDDADGLTLLAEVRLDRGDLAGARQSFENALRASPNSPDANRAFGVMLLSEKRFPEAMDRFETVLGILPHDAVARRSELDAATRLAVSAHEAGHPEASLKVFEHARIRLPDDPALLLELGLQALELNQLAEASESLTAARKLNPENPEIVYALARVEIEQQHMPVAETDLRTYLAARPNDASAHFGLGHVLAVLQRDDAARKEFERSIELQPAQTESYFQIGQLELHAHRDGQAEALFQKVIARDPNHGGALTGLGELAFRAKDYAKAENYLNHAVQAAPQYGAAHYQRALALARLGRKEEADKELAAAAQLSKATGAAADGTPVGPK
ncbi:MAG TPA: tetratricopeptide repeat protein [Acidobacteriaceae bacterium]|jgi:tetratricopeptide (TPR) repeat protein